MLLRLPGRSVPALPRASKRVLALLLLAATGVSAPLAGNLPNLRTGGFDYDERVIDGSQSEATFLATHHDWVIGAQGHSSGTTFDKMKEQTYDMLKLGNPAVLLIGYVPFQTVQPWMSTWMENYASTHGLDPEDLYCHYAVDTTVLDRDGTTRTFAGYPNGSATGRAGSRVMTTWWHGSLPNICPQSGTFRTAYSEMLKYAVTINAAGGKYLDGIMLDSFNCTVDTYYNLHLENSVEMRNLGKTTNADARAQWINDAIAYVPVMRQAVASTIGRTAYILPNAGDADDVYNWYKDVFADRFSPDYNLFAVEYLITPGFDSMTRIARLKSFYDDLSHATRPVTFFFTSHTSYTTGVPFNFTQFELASHLLINHPNGLFCYHVGSPANYGALNGQFEQSHWHVNEQYDMGKPVVRTGTDYWGASNTDRFYLLQDGGSTYKVLARDYDNGMVVANFGNVAGWANIGINPVAVTLPGTFHRLQADNTLGPAITSITLGFEEGAILVRDTPPPSNNPPPAPGNNRRNDVS